MSTRTAPVRPRRGALRSPLAAATQSLLSPTCLPAGTGTARSQPAAADPRSLTLAEFGDYLRTINNRDGRPYEDTTINAHVFAAKALDAWMTANSLDGDFTTVDTAMLNRYFARTTRPTAKAAPTPSSADVHNLRQPDGDDILFSTIEGRHKTTNMLRKPRVTLL